MEVRIRELHAQGMINKEIVAQLNREGMTCGDSIVSKKLRKLGLESHGKRLGGRRKQRQAKPEPQEEVDDEGPFYREQEEPVVVPAAKKRRGHPPKKSAPTEEGEYPVIGYAPHGAPQFGSMRMKVIEEEIVDGHKVKVLPPGYAQGASP